MPPSDIDKLEKLHDKLNRKLEKWERKKLKALLKSFREAEKEIKALLVDAAEWEKVRLESLLAEVDRIIDKLDHKAEMWVKGQGDVQPGDVAANLSQYPALTGGEAALTSIGISATFTAVHMPVLSYMQDYNLGLIKNVTHQLREQIKEHLKRGYIMGDSIPDIAKRLRDTKLNKGVWPTIEKRAEVIARTEILRASNQGALTVYKQYDVKRVRWLTAADERVCSVCGPLHRRVFPIDQIPFGGPPAHPRCRCFATANIATSEEEGRLLDDEARQNAEEFKVRENEKSAKRQEKVAEKIKLEEEYRADIKSGKYKLTVRENIQKRHIEGTKEYLDYVARLEQKGSKVKPSILSVDAQALINRFAGTGRIIVQKKGGPPKEVIDAGTVVGKYFDEGSGKFLESTRAMIVYSSKGIHVYPAAPAKE